jgi:hypothetical protein
MSTTVTVTLRDDVYRKVRQLAQLANLKVSEVLTEAIELSLLPGSPQPFTVKSAAELPDDEILKLAELQMSPSQDRRLSRLLHRQQAGKLTSSERAEMLTLMQLYHDGLLRKAQALREAVRRGLREPVKP